MRKLLLGMWILSLAGAAIAQIPAAAPKKTSAEALDEATPTSLPARFDNLNKRSIFIKGMQTIDNSVPRVETPTSIPYQSEEAASQQAVLVFNAAIEADGHFIAFIEDTKSGKVSTVQIGEEMAMGKISNIIHDGETWQLDFETPAGITHVLIGQNMQGVKTPLAGSTVAATQVAGPASAPAGGDDPITRMRLRRLQESGGK